MQPGSQQKSYEHVDFSHPDKGCCDLVMKGGVTSGMVYLPAILELASHYEFCDIGGTSAGAIAAAVTAAAEMGRTRDGFRNLERARNQLQQPGFLRALFQASWWTTPLMNLLLHLVAGNGSRSAPMNPPSVLKGIVSAWNMVAFVLKLVISCVRNDLFVFAAGLLGSLLLGVLLAGSSEAILAWWQWRLTAAAIGGIAVCPIHMLAIMIWVIYQQANLFGLSSGLRRHNSRQPGLIDWLSGQLDLISGKTTTPLSYKDMQQGKQGDRLLAPLTFKDLRQARGMPQVNLKMVTTDLSHHQPYLLPLEVHGFLFREDELRQFFPAYVVHQYMADAVREDTQLEMSFPGTHGKQLTMMLSLDELNHRLGEGRHYHLLPPGEKLPVIVATRMSLSFPILFKAVPLWTVNTAVLDAQRAGSRYKLKQQDLQQHVFSDGGISSNFPIHVFDAWLPTHPTFDINLTDLPREAFSRPAPSPGALLKRMVRSVFHRHPHPQ